MKRVNKGVTEQRIDEQCLRAQRMMIRTPWAKAMVVLCVSTPLGLSGLLGEVGDRVLPQDLTVSWGTAWAQEPESERSRSGWLERLLAGEQDDVAKDSARTSHSWQQVFGFWDRFLGDRRDDVADDPGRTSRGDVCLVSPNVPAPSDPSESAASTIAQVWHPQPTFVWTGRVEAIALRVAESEETIMEQTVLGRWSATYDEMPLEFGQTYEWVVDPATPSDGFLVASFQMVSADKYEQIGLELEAIEASLAESEPTAEALALTRAEYFAQQHLWADMWREVLTVEEPSDELMELYLAELNLPCRLPAMMEEPIADGDFLGK